LAVASRVLVETLGSRESIHPEENRTASSWQWTWNYWDRKEGSRPRHSAAASRRIKTVKQLKKKSKMLWRGLDAARTFLASGSGRSVFRLTSPSIGLPGTPRLAQDQRQRHRISIPRWSGRFGCLSEPVLWGLV